MSGNLVSKDILPLIKETMQFIASFEGDIPGATPRDCGNYSFMNLPEAKSAAKRYLNLLLEATDINFTYPAE